MRFLAKRNKVLDILLLVILFVYLYLLLDLLFLSRGWMMTQERAAFRPVNLVPFQTISEYSEIHNTGLAFRNIVGNIIIFFPCGIYLALYRKKKNILSCVLIALGLSIGVEAIQYYFGLGSADIDDVILNTLGGLLGALFYRLVLMIAKNQTRAKNVIAILAGVVGFPMCAMYILPFLLR